ncbi:MAG: type II secretion system protein GspL [Thermodesulfobacteriota bacterium]|nr:type II secretion system protein GspL [Thermodesulfobacteriota bacterium]
MSIKTWGLDFGSTGIKAVELTRTWQGHRVTNYGFYPYSSAEKARGEKLQILAKIFPGGEKEGKNIIVSLPSHRMMVHRLSLPFKERKKNQQVIKFEVEPLLPLAIDQVLVDFYMTKGGPDGNKALAFAVRKEELKEQLSLMEEAGLDPESVVPEALALFWLARNLKIGISSGALLDVGQEKTTMIVWHDENLTLIRSISIAGMVTPALSHLADEVKRTLISYESSPAGQPVEKIFLTGGSAALPGIEEVFGENPKIPVAILDINRISPALMPDVPEEHHHALAVALGAAFRESAREAERVNFRQEEFVSVRKAKKEKTRVTLLVSYAIILAVLGIAAFSVNLYLKERKYQDLKAEIRKEFLQTQPGVKKVVNEVQQMKNFVQEEKARVDALGGLSKVSSPLEILREFSTIVEADWKIRVTDLIVEPETVEVGGEADSFETVNRIKSKLDKSHLYKDVQLKTARASALENVIEFKFQMKRGI